MSNVGYDKTARLKPVFWSVSFFTGHSVSVEPVTALNGDFHEATTEGVRFPHGIQELELPSTCPATTGKDVGLWPHPQTPVNTVTPTNLR